MMKRSFLFYILLAACLSISCLEKDSPVIDTSGWIDYQLDNHWIFKAPKGAKIVYERGVDSVPGNIILEGNSVNLEFDSTYEGSNDTICSLSSELLRAREKVARGDYKFRDKPGMKHIVKADTINGMAAVIITPTKAGAGATDIFINNCRYYSGLGIYGKNLSAANQNLVLEIFKSIRYKAGK
ncbi:hypothetical protein [Hymenobacter convexus]|uniref:hypothetical protein n=1 Tax=Hymenobacter sp. CA1UV-4 TaxID=3063782 RepID=UPI002713BBD9|nr:hypothetical protein [Hymenobacter sp. CA1UV-4]MDO7854248.1 hypothetical protein [Hymenobacter sp. CA1UV-4]